MSIIQNKRFERETKHSTRKIRKELKLYNRMHKKHQKALMKIAKSSTEYDYNYLSDYVYEFLKGQYEYFSEGNNVWGHEESVSKKAASIKEVLEKFDELYSLWTTDTVDNGLKDKNFLQNTANREKELYKEIFTYIGENLRSWFD